MVRPGGAVDAPRARVNTTSVYTAAGVFPMLPEPLSTDLTSLHEGEERLAVVVDMTGAADGTVTASDVYRAAVLNRAKLTYDGVVGLAGRRGGRTAATRGACPGCEEQLRLHDARGRASCGSGASSAAR